MLIDFLNEVFRGRKHIADLSYSQNEHHREGVTEGVAIFDLYCTGNDGEKLIIEMQRGRHPPGWIKKEPCFIPAA